LRIRKGCLSHEVVAQSIGDAGGRSGDGPMREIQEASHTGGLSTSDKESKPPRVGVTMLEPAGRLLNEQKSPSSTLCWHLRPTVLDARERWEEKTGIGRFYATQFLRRTSVNDGQVVSTAGKYGA